jgi:hypothetical protein
MTKPVKGWQVSERIAWIIALKISAVVIAILRITGYYGIAG